MCAHGSFAFASRSRCPAASRTTTSKRSLDVQTKMTDSDLPGAGHNAGPNRAGRGAQQLGPAAARCRLGSPGRTSNAAIALSMIRTDAQFLLQANVLQVGRTSKAAAEGAFAKGFGSPGRRRGRRRHRSRRERSDRGDHCRRGRRRGRLGGRRSVRPGGHLQHHHRRADLERAHEGVVVTERMTQDLAQGRSGARAVDHRGARLEALPDPRAEQREPGQLDFEDAAPDLVAGLTQAIAGIF